MQRVTLECNVYNNDATCFQGSYCSHSQTTCTVQESDCRKTTREDKIWSSGIALETCSQCNCHIVIMEQVVDGYFFQMDSYFWFKKFRQICNRLQYMSVTVDCGRLESTTALCVLVILCFGHALLCVLQPFWICLYLRYQGCNTSLKCYDANHDRSWFFMKLWRIFP